ncbi:MAG: acyloxyacyl hydrolase [Bacteroidales bacterium]|nr:acyloxyacyl hydrolase [Bacteroidales bacterium]
MKLFSVIIVFFLSCNIMQASGDSSSFKSYKIVGLKIHKGFIIIHSKAIRQVKDSYPFGIELDLIWQYTSEKSWETCNCYPRLGVSLTFWNFDNKDILGNGITSLFFIEPVFGAQNNISFSFRAGLGLTYHNKPYDELSNPNNMSYSTYLFFPLQLGAALNIRLSPLWRLNLSANYNHISNGGIKEPNKGINYPTAAVGVNYFLREPEFKIRTKRNWKMTATPESRFDITIFSAFKQHEYKRYYPIPGIELKGSRQVSKINALTVGLEWLYDNAARYYLNQSGKDISCQKTSVALGNEFLLGRFLFSQQIGVYFFKPYKKGDYIYQRYGLVFRATEWFSLGINLKAHRHVADFLDFRLGYSF